MDGLASPANSTLKGRKGLLRPKQYPNCDESNKPEAKFCTTCKFVLSFDAFNEAVKEADEREKDLQSMKESQQRLMEAIKLTERELVQVDKQLQAQTHRDARSSSSNKRIIEKIFKTSHKLRFL